MSFIDDPILKPAEVASQLGVKTATVWLWCREGKISFIALSRRNFRIRQSAVNEFLRSATR
jgi:excisionase family DNA binding protein